jgi:hypothetical protein
MQSHKEKVVAAVEQIAGKDAALAAEKVYGNMGAQGWQELSSKDPKAAADLKEAMRLATGVASGKITSVSDAEKASVATGFSSAASIKDNLAPTTQAAAGPSNQATQLKQNVDTRFENALKELEVIQANRIATRDDPDWEKAEKFLKDNIVNLNTRLLAETDPKKQSEIKQKIDAMFQSAKNLSNLKSDVMDSFDDQDKKVFENFKQISQMMQTALNSNIKIAQLVQKDQVLMETWNTVIDTGVKKASADNANAGARQANAENKELEAQKKLLMSQATTEQDLRKLLEEGKITNEDFDKEMTDRNKAELRRIQEEKKILLETASDDELANLVERGAITSEDYNKEMAARIAASRKAQNESQRAATSEQQFNLRTVGNRNRELDLLARQGGYNRRNDQRPLGVFAANNVVREMIGNVNRGNYVRAARIGRMDADLDQQEDELKALIEASKGK